MIHDFFDEAHLDEVARCTGFVRRKSGINGYNLLWTLLNNRLKSNHLSLEDIAFDLCQHFDVEVTKEAVNQRFTDRTVTFFKTLLEELIPKSISNIAELKSGHFSNLKIKDSTCFQLPEFFVSKYPGSGGSGSVASVRIQFEYDLLSGRISDLSLHAFNEQDNRNAVDTLADISEGELTIRDLGYVQTATLAHHDQVGAYYAYRLPTATKAFEAETKDATEMDFTKLYKAMCRNNLTWIGRDIWLGVIRQPTRLLVIRVPEAVYKSRLVKAQQQAKKKGTAVSKNKKLRLRFQLYITNITEEKLPIKYIGQLYRIRWQIELLFKTWKSYGGLHHIKQMKIPRFECQLYAQLIWLTMHWKATAAIGYWMYLSTPQKPSFQKLAKRLLIKSSEIVQLLHTGLETLQNYFADFLKAALRYCKFERKKGTPAYYDLLRIVL